MIVFLFKRALVLGCIFGFIAVGCTRFVPTITVKGSELRVVRAPDNETGMTEAQALNYVIQQLNATKHGLCLQQTSSRLKQIFPFDELWVTMIEKQDKKVYGLLNGKITPGIVVSSSCSTTASYANIYYFPLVKAETVRGALIALGAEPCFVLPQ